MNTPTRAKGNSYICEYCKKPITPDDWLKKYDEYRLVLVAHNTCREKYLRDLYAKATPLKIS